MKKIIIEKEEGVAEIIDRVLEESEDELTLVVPKGSGLGKTVRNFYLLQREADAAGKTLTIESVDETILSYAKESGIEGNHPLWQGVHGSGGISDILPASAMDDEAPKGRKGAAKKGKKAEPVRLVVPVEEVSEEVTEEEVSISTNAGGIEEEIEETDEKEDQFLGIGRFFKKGPSWAKKEEDEDNDRTEDDEDGMYLNDRESRGGSRRLIWGAVITAAVLIGGFFIVTWFFGRVAISIEFKKTAWSTQGTVVADKSVSTPNGTQIPAQIFTTKKNTTQTFPASGSANVSIKAQGTLTIVNAYSSAKQDLVATTRFVTPDGKIFRLAGAVTVPGAQVTDGKIVPSSIEATVVADQAGPSYNIGATDKLTIPGFQGSAKYTAFYGQLKGGTNGGFVGTRAVPTAADIAAAKSKVTLALQTNLASSITTSYPNNFKILDGATNVQVTKLTVNTSTDSSGAFSVFGEASLQAIGFDETALKNYLLSQAQAELASSTFSALTLTYSGVQPDFGKGKVTFALAAQGSLKPLFSADDFKAQILGKSITVARTEIAGLPELANGKISAWPMWLWNVPSNPGKVDISSN